MGIAAWIKERQMTQREFADLVHSTPAAVHRWSSGQSIPSPALMANIYKVTRGQVTPNDFYDFPRLPKPPEPHPEDEAA